MNMRSYDNNDQMLRFFKLLADKNRYKIVRHLNMQEDCVCTMAESLDMDQSLLSHHLKKMSHEGLVQTRKVGSWVHYSLNIDAFKQFEKQFKRELSTENYSPSLCVDHEACKKIMEVK